jgi:hypothetical protein
MIQTATGSAVKYLMPLQNPLRTIYLLRVKSVNQARQEGSGLWFRSGKVEGQISGPPVVHSDLKATLATQ